MVDMRDFIGTRYANLFLCEITGSDHSVTATVRKFYDVRLDKAMVSVVVGQRELLTPIPLEHLNSGTTFVAIENCMRSVIRL